MKTPYEKTYIDLPIPRGDGNERIKDHPAIPPGEFSGRKPLPAVIYLSLLKPVVKERNQYRELRPCRSASPI
jgi:hypothetical protein